MSVWNSDYGVTVCRTCHMPPENAEDAVDHPTIYGCLAALGKEISRINTRTTEPSGDEE